MKKILVSMMLLTGFTTFAQDSTTAASGKFWRAFIVENGSTHFQQQGQYFHKRG